MSKYGYAALLALACGALSPLAHAQRQFFVAGQFGEATYEDVEAGEDSADTQAFSLGYRWQAGPYVQVGIEAGAGRVDAIRHALEYSDSTFRSLWETSLETRYKHIGANARFAFGASRWFAIARGGYADFRADLDERSEVQTLPFPPETASRSTALDSDGAYFGAGVGVDLTRYLSVNVMDNGYAYSDFSESAYDEDIDTASAATLGVELRF
jgi:hypothetical protein